MQRRLNIRITEALYESLCELRLLHKLPSDSLAIRWAIDRCHEQDLEAIRKQRRRKGYALALQVVIEGSDT